MTNLPAHTTVVCAEPLGSHKDFLTFLIFIITDVFWAHSLDRVLTSRCLSPHPRTNIIDNKKLGGDDGQTLNNYIVLNAGALASDGSLEFLGGWVHGPLLGFFGTGCVPKAAIGGPCGSGRKKDILNH